MRPNPEAIDDSPSGSPVSTDLAYSRVFVRTNENFSQVGRADGWGFSPGRAASEGHVPAAVRNPGKTRAALAAGDRPAQRALCLAASRGAGIRGGFPGILLWANL